jgi:hypothetical protein
VTVNPAKSSDERDKKTLGREYGLATGNRMMSLARLIIGERR